MNQTPSLRGGVADEAVHHRKGHGLLRFARNDTGTALRSQNATLKTGRGQHRKYLPYAFTEHGAIMAATVLNSPRAIEMSVFVVRAFVQLREMLSTHKKLAAKLAALERKVGGHDQAIVGLIDAIRQLMAPPETKKRSIGFLADREGSPAVQTNLGSPRPFRHRDDKNMETIRLPL